MLSPKMTDNIMCRGRYADGETWVHTCGYAATCARYVGQLHVAHQVPVADYLCSDALPDRFVAVETAGGK